MLILLLNPIRSMPAAIVALCCASTPLIAEPASSDTPSHFNDQGSAMAHVRVEMVFDRSAISPGGAAMIGVRFLIEGGWHLYWRNNGDSGLPIGVTFEAPEGVLIGPILWPAPERHVYGIGSVDYIYQRETALLARVEIDDRFRPGDRVEITASFELLACREICVFGKGERSIVIDIAESTTMTELAWMKKNRARIPRRDQSPLDIRWDGTDLLISVYDQGEIRSMSYFPFEPTDPRPMHPDIDGISETGSLRVAYPPQIIGAPRVAGIVEIVGPEGPVWIEIESTPPESQSGRGGVNEPTPSHQQTQSTRNRSGD